MIRERTWDDEAILDALLAWYLDHGEQPTGSDWKKAGYGHPSAQTVRHRFGTWDDALKAAGLEPLYRPRARLSWRRHWQTCDAICVCPVCEQLVPYRSDCGRLVDHYSDRAEDRFYPEPNYFCRGSMAEVAAGGAV